MSITPSDTPFPGTPNLQRTDVYSQLYQHRIIFVNKALDDEFANQIIAELLYLEANDSSSDIQLVINSSGGSITAGLAVYDTIQCLQSDVVTVCSGLAAMMATFLLAVGTKGKRAALPNARILLQQPSITTPQTGQAAEIEIVARELLYLRQRLNQIYAEVTGKAIAQIQQDTERDFSLSALEAQAYGLIDQILSN
jgi:ATP-dependent Clp protease protease subunit